MGKRQENTQCVNTGQWAATGVSAWARDPASRGSIPRRSIHLNVTGINNLSNSLDFINT